MNEIRDWDRRLNNIILFNIPESDSEDHKMGMDDDQPIIQDLCKTLKVNAMFTKVTRPVKIIPKEHSLRATCDDQNILQEIKGQRFQIQEYCVKTDLYGEERAKIPTTGTGSQ